MTSNIAPIPLTPTLHISPILTGLWQIADMERDGKTLDLVQAAQAMQPYVDAGLTTFDMADHYGSAELIAGIYRQQLAEEGQIQLFTKWVPEPGKSSLQKVRTAIQRSLDRLQMERLDLLQYHAWNYADPSWLDDMYGLQQLQQEGLIRHIGMTNTDTAHMHVLKQSGIEVVSNQICFSLLDQRAANKMCQWCEEHHVKLLAFGTLAGGFLTDFWVGKAEPKMESLSSWSQMKYKRFIDEAGGWQLFQQLLQRLQQVANKHRASIANVASKYILDQPAVASIIIGARLGKSEHIESNLHMLALKLDEEDRNLIQNVLNKLHPIPGDCGDEYRKPPFLTASGDLSHHLDALPVPYPAQQINDHRSKVLSGTIWEDLAGFSRAVRIENRILVSGTTATHGDKVIGGSDPAAQAHFVIDKIEGAIQSLGGKLEDVVRTRIYIQRMDDWEAISKVHGERFRHIQPANTLIRADIIGEEYWVEMEAEAVVLE